MVYSNFNMERICCKITGCYDTICEDEDDEDKYVGYEALEYVIN